MNCTMHDFIYMHKELNLNDVRPIRPVLTRMHPYMLIAYKQICTQTCMTCFLRRKKFTYLPRVHRAVPRFLFIDLGKLISGLPLSK